jgi:preprotein translocase subunit SecF
MDTDRVIELLEEIRALQRQQVEGQQQALRNQQEAIRAQHVAMARGRKLQAALGIVIAVVLITVLVLLRFVLRRYS